MKATRIIVFAKAPQPGQVKTRLIPVLGSAGAATLATALLADALHRAQAADLGPVELCASPAIGHPAWSEVPLPPGLEFSDQGHGDLGVRMARACRRGLRQQPGVLLIGSDCPGLSPAHLRRAAEALASHDAALYPALDGGYPLLGLRACHPSLFAAMPWSTERVAALTLERLAGLGWRVWQGEALADIDTPADLGRLPQELAELARQQTH